MTNQPHAIQAINLLNEIQVSNNQMLDEMMNLISKVNADQKNSYDSLQSFRSNFDRLITNLEDIKIEEYLEPEDKAKLSIV